MYKLDFHYFSEFHAITYSLFNPFFGVSEEIDNVMIPTLRSKVRELGKNFSIGITYNEKLPENSYILLNEVEALWLSEWLQVNLKINSKIAALKNRLVTLDSVPLLEAA